MGGAIPRFIVAWLSLGAVFGLSSAPSASLAAALEDYKQGRYDEALCEFERLALKGDAVAQFRLGRMYRDGVFVSPSVSEAIKWLRRAATAGHIVAQTELADLYATEGSPQRDDVLALRWYKTAASQIYVGYSGAASKEHANSGLRARKDARTLGRRLTDEQVARARKLVEESEGPVVFDAATHIRFLSPEGVPPPDRRLAVFVTPAFPLKARHRVDQKKAVNGASVKIRFTIRRDGVVADTVVESAVQSDNADENFLTRYIGVDDGTGDGVTPDEYSAGALDAVNQWRFVAASEAGLQEISTAIATIDFSLRPNPANSGTIASMQAGLRENDMSWIWSRATLDPGIKKLKRSSRIHVSYYPAGQPESLTQEVTENLAAALARSGFVAGGENPDYRAVYGFGTKVWEEHFTHYFAITLTDADNESGNIVWKGEARLDTYTRDPCDPLELVERLMAAAVAGFGKTIEWTLIEEE